MKWLVLLLLPLLWWLNLCVGSVSIPLDDCVRALTGDHLSAELENYRYILLELRLPSAMAALWGGSALAVSGLLLQVLFRNPLAGPSMLGITSGANLGVALITLLGGSLLSASSLLSSVPAVVAALSGTAVVMGVLLWFSRRVSRAVSLLLIGILLSSFIAALITLLTYFSTSDDIRSFVVWGMGTFQHVALGDLPAFSILSFAGLFSAVLLIKPLSVFLLGEEYAANSGVNVRRFRFRLLCVSGLLAGVTTAYCGPVAFMGLVIPHVARMFLSSSNPRRLLPWTMYAGACVALLSNLCGSLPLADGQPLPLNVVTSIWGVPMVIYIILRNQRA